MHFENTLTYIYCLDIIRQYQAKQLYDEYKLSSLYIYRDTISKSFENQVLARSVALFIVHCALPNAGC